MQFFLGLIVVKPLLNKERYLQCLKEIKHYLSFQTSIIIHDTQNILTLKASSGSNMNSFSLVKNCVFLHTQYQYQNIQGEEDFIFIQACYQVLTIIKEYFASHIQIQLKGVDQFDEQSQEQTKIYDFVKNLQHIKQEQFSRRVTSNLKSSMQSTQELKKQDIENYLYLIQNHYNRKAKSFALKILASSRVLISQWVFISQEDIQLINSMATDQDYALYVTRILENILKAKKQQFNNQNSFRQANVFQRSDFKASPVKQYYQRPFVVKEVSKQTEKSIKSSKISQNYSIKTLLFQLKQSNSIQRIIKLMQCIDLQNIQQKYLFKLDQVIEKICKCFLRNQYKGQQNNVKQFYEGLIQFLQKRGQCGISKEVLQKIEDKIQMLQNLSHESQSQSIRD